VRFFVIDVFTDRPFAGNPLAVVPDAHGLSPAVMQRIAAEFGFSETAFVFPDSTATWRVRIFTPAAELPFAGHPLVGSAFALARFGYLPADPAAPDLPLLVAAGEIEARIRFDGELPAGAELRAPGALAVGEPADPRTIADFLGLAPAELVPTGPLPCRVHHGLDFLMVRLADEAALERAAVRGSLPEALLPHGLDNGVYLFTESADGEGTGDIRARMFAPAHGIAEDPATGSAAAALAALLAHLDPGRDGLYRRRIHQGREMGRPSLIETEVRKSGGRLREVRIGGRCALLAEGELLL